MVVIPQAFAAATVSREGAAGQAWLHDVPAIAADACHRWRCTLDGNPWHGQVALVVPVQHASGPAAIKISFPHASNRGEPEALHCFDGRGAVRLVDVDASGLVLLLERAEPLTLADRLAQATTTTVDEAIEIAGDLARRLAVPPSPAITPLSDTTDEWEQQLDAHIAAAPGLVTTAAVDQARRTIRALGDDITATMLHGDLHFDNILRSHREPWLAIDPKGWSGTPAWDAFTVIAGRREDLQQYGDIGRAIGSRIRRYSAAARVDPDLSVACCQARAVSSYLCQHLAAEGTWFDLEFLRALTQDHALRRSS